MPASPDIRHSPRRETPTSRTSIALSPTSSAPSATPTPPTPPTPSVITSAALNHVLTTNSPVRLVAGAVGEFKDRRRRRRVEVPAMYSSVSLRLLSRQGPPLEGHILDLSETGMAVEIDDQIPPGQPVTVEFSLAGLGRQRQAPGESNGQWPSYAVAAEVVRIDDLEDFPGGPYRTALRFVRIPTMVQAQIARYVVTQPARVS